MPDLGSRSFKPNMPYFVCDPYNEGMVYFTTAEDRDMYAKAIITNCLDASDKTWTEDVDHVHVGVVTGCAEKVNYKERPPEEELDDGVDGDGEYWGAGVDMKYNVKIGTTNMAKAVLES